MLGLLKLWSKEIIMVVVLLYVIYYIYGKGYDSATTDRDLADAKIMLEQRVKYEALELRYDLLVNETENKINQLVGDIDEAYAQGVKEATRTTDDVIAGWRTSADRLSIELASSTRKTNSSNTKGSADTSSDNDNARAELSDKAARFLIGEAQRADRITLQLAACQKLAQAYRTVFAEYEIKAQKTN